MNCLDRFIKDWKFIQTLGEGAYGEVKLATNGNQDLIAVKVINAGSINGSQSSLRPTDIDAFIKKEVVIHKALKCKNIIRFIGMRKEAERIYIFLEYVSGGELFDRIEPDIGVPRSQARYFFSQLLDGIDYIHSKGITHRDIKPENILFDSRDTLKICDFGLATMFRFQGRERKLTRRCGTICYVAPEVMYIPYNAQPAELWSCGVVLYTMLLGQLPWNEPTKRDHNYTDWMQGNIHNNKFWNRLTEDDLSIFKGILSIHPSDRLTIEEITKHRWFTENTTIPAIFERCVLLDDDTLPYVSSTQPVNIFSAKSSTDFSSHYEVFLSQPLNIEEIYLENQFATQTPTSVQYSSLCILTKRLTRIFFDLNLQSTVNILSKILSILRIDSKLTSDHSNACVRVMTTDFNGQMLQFNLLLYCFSGCSTMVDFRRTKGSALEFKRKFKLIENFVKNFSSSSLFVDK